MTDQLLRVADLVADRIEFLGSLLSQLLLGLIIRFHLYPFFPSVSQVPTLQLPTHEWKDSPSPSVNISISLIWFMLKSYLFSCFFFFFRHSPCTWNWWSWCVQPKFCCLPWYFVFIQTQSPIWSTSSFAYFASRILTHGTCGNCYSIQAGFCWWLWV